VDETGFRGSANADDNPSDAAFGFIDTLLR